eukprot:3363139-Amphidinium_carterae.2
MLNQNRIPIKIIYPKRRRRQERQRASDDREGTRGAAGHDGGTVETARELAGEGNARELADRGFGSTRQHMSSSSIA